MGQRGTEVAREAAAIVLLDDDFASLAQAVRLGRRIYDNIGKACAYIVAVHIPTAGIALVPLLVGWPLAFFPLHVMFLELIIDPACSVAFEAEPQEGDVMRRPPRAVSARLFSGSMVVASVLQGLGLLVAAILVYGFGLETRGEESARAMAFVTIVLGNLILILLNRSTRAGFLLTLRRPNPTFWIVVFAACLATTLVLALPEARRLFRFGPLSALDVGSCAAMAAASLVWVEIRKWVQRHRQASAGA
jgi:Ca2+-transporting ATPase